MTARDRLFVSLPTALFVLAAVRTAVAYGSIDLSRSADPATPIRVWAPVAGNHVEVTRNPFRISGLMSQVRIGETAQAISQERSNPGFSVRATIGGPPWSAILVGVSGVEGGLVVVPGDNVEDYTVDSITSAHVYLSSGGLTWSLGLQGEHR